MEDFIDDKELNDLFRQKLENAEITPSPALNQILMRKVGMKEFLRFDPARFNIWYAGAAVAAAGTTLALILTMSPSRQNSELKVGQPVENQVSVDHSVTNDLHVTSNVPVENNKPGRSFMEKSASPETDLKSDEKAYIEPSVSVTGNSLEAQKVTDLPSTAVIDDIKSDNKLIGNTISQSLIEASVTEGCSPLKVSFTSLAGAEDICYWQFGDGGNSSLRNPVWIFDNPGEFYVTLKVTNRNEKLASSIRITVHPKPVAKFEILPESAVLPRDEISFRNYSENAVIYRWDFGDGTTSDLFEPMHSYQRYGTYNVQLIAASEYGCSDSLVIYNAFSSSGNFIEFPNAFIPNPTGPSGGYYSPKSDESSQIFHPVHSGVTEYQLRIFSKRGIMVFESNDVNFGWDGYYKGQICDPGVYVWKVRGKFINNGQFTKVGDLTLLKN